MCRKVLPYMPALQPYRGKPAVRNDREGRGNVGIIRSPIRASTLPDGAGIGNGALPHGRSYRAHPRLYRGVSAGMSAFTESIGG
jgi:hypothetical protein